MLGQILQVIIKIIEVIAYIIYYFYVHILPFMIKYIGIPMFLFGCAISGGFAISFLFIIIGGSFIYYTYVKKIISISPPVIKRRDKLNTNTQQ